MADSVGLRDRAHAARAPRVALVSGWDTEDPGAWSGVMVPLRQALGRALPLVALRVQAGVHPVDRALARLSGRCGHGYLPGHALATARRQGRVLRELVARSEVDAVVAVACSTAVATARLDVPVVQVTDATVRALTDYYPDFTGLAGISLWQAERLERASQRASAAVVVASQWARASFLHDYAVAPERVTVAPFGPAISPGLDDHDAVPPRSDERATGTETAWRDGAALDGPTAAETGELCVLCVVADWHRKGGDRAVAAVERLRARGAHARLTVVGDAPEGMPSWVSCPGRVPARALSALFAHHDVLLELSRASAAGVTLTDAAAHGLPVVAADTGGVADIVDHGSTGYLVRDATGTDRALDLLRSAPRRAAMSRRATQRARDVLDWDVWAAHVAGVVRELTHRGPVAASEGR